MNASAKGMHEAVQSPQAPSKNGIPSHPAAITLLSLDVILLAAPIIVPWQSWFIWAYTPLLFTVALGMKLAGLRKRTYILLGLVPAVLMTALKIALFFPSQSMERIGYILMFGEILLGCLGAIIAVLAVRGWFIFSQGQPND